MSDKKFEMIMLFDFYGDLLTDRQREYFDLYYNDDLSLSEIAEQFGISRQGVRDIIVRAEVTLNDLEEKIGMVARFTEIGRLSSLLTADAEKILSVSGDDEVCALARSMIEKLGQLKG